MVSTIEFDTDLGARFIRYAHMDDAPRRDALLPYRCSRYIRRSHGCTCKS